jgi:hypothetical protein
VRGKRVSLEPRARQTQVGGLSPSNLMPHFFAIEACSTAIICPFIWASSAAACLSPPTRNAAGLPATGARGSIVLF